MRSKNSCVQLSERSRGRRAGDIGRLLASNLKILRNILLQDDTEFVKVWSKPSKSLVFYESGQIYFENYRRCYSSLLPEPRQLYERPRIPNTEKIEDALLCQCPLEKVLPNVSEQKASLVALTAHNWLYRVSTYSGETLQRVYLSSRIKFRSLSWDSSQETFYVKSVQSKQTLMERQAGVENNVLMHLAVFQVFPLDLVGVLEIDKKVFGKGVVDVLLSDGVLAVSHSSKHVRLYSFEYIVDKFRVTKLSLGQTCEMNSVDGVVGEAPFGIPVNIQINECPPVLFDISYLESGAQIGGLPWHYIYTPNQQRHRGSHHICSIADGALARNGIQEMKCDSLEEDWIFFHPGDSRRIVHAGPSTINVLKIRAEAGSDEKYEIVTDFSISAARDEDVSSRVIVTSSGRTVKRRFQMLDDDPEQETFRMVKYEDELDLLAVLEISHNEEQAQLRLHDDKTGDLLKKVPLSRQWDVTYSHEVYFDRDTIIHTEQEKNSSYRCHVYKMRRSPSDES